MIDPLFDEAAVRRSGLAETRLFKDLAREPVGLVDVGARWGVSDLFKSVPKLFEVLCFEADKEEARRIAEDRAQAELWADFRVSDKALAGRSGTETLHLLEKPNNSSIYPVNSRFARRYDLKGFALVRKVAVETTTLDEVIFNSGLAFPRSGEILKIDVQGAEWDVMQGGGRTLSERTHCVLCETAFLPVYDGMKLFSEIELAMRERGFTFLGFLDIQQRSTKSLDKRRFRARERFMHADSVFVRDPLSAPDPGAVPLRAYEVVMLSALLLGFLDFALELATAAPWSADERGAFRRAVEALAETPPEALAASLGELHDRVARDPGAALVDIGRFVDRSRDFHTYHDVPAPQG